MRTLIQATTLIIVALGTASCLTTKPKAAASPSPEALAMEQRYQAEIRRLQTVALQQSTDKEDDHLAEALSAMPESGAVGWALHETVITNPDGTPATDKDGNVVKERQEAIGKSNSMREIQSVDAVAFTLGGLPTDPSTGKILSDKLVGLYLTLKQGGANSGLDADFARVWSERSVAERQAGADAAADYLRTKLEGRAEIINAVGERVSGVLKEVYRATPIGAGMAAVEVLIESEDGGEERGTMAEPLRED